MKKFVFLFLVLTSFLFSESFFEEDDKQMHMKTTFVISLIASNMAYDVGYTVNQSFWIGVTSALVAGLSKELFDSRKGGSGFSGEDMVANFIGGVGGAVWVYPLYKF